MYLPLDTVMLFRSEFLKELNDFNAEIYDYDDGISAAVIEDSLILSIEIIGEPADPCGNAEEMYGYYRDNLYLEFPVKGKNYYRLQIIELTPNKTEFKHNHSEFLRRMKELTGIDFLTAQMISYTHFNADPPYVRPGEVSPSERFDQLFPDLRIMDRVNSREGNTYRFVVLEMEDKNNEIHRAVAFTRQQPEEYLTDVCGRWIDTGRLSGIATNNGIVERKMNAAFSSWKGMRRRERLEGHLRYFSIERKVRSLAEAYGIQREILIAANRGGYPDIKRKAFRSI